MNQRNQEVPELNKNEKTAQQKSLGAYITKQNELNGATQELRKARTEQNLSPEDGKDIKTQSKCNKIEMKKTIRTKS